MISTKKYKFFRINSFYFLYFSNLSLIEFGENPNSISKITTNKIIVNSDKISAIGIQSGEVTHHQDQSIFPVSLRTKKTIKRTPAKLKPDDEFFDAMIINLYLIYLKCCFFFEFLWKILVV